MGGVTGNKHKAATLYSLGASRNGGNGDAMDKFSDDDPPRGSFPNVKRNLVGLGASRGSRVGVEVPFTFGFSEDARVNSKTISVARNPLDSVVTVRTTLANHGNNFPQIGVFLRKDVGAEADDLTSRRDPVVVEAHTRPDTSPLGRQERIHQAAKFTTFRALDGSFKSSMSVKGMTFANENPPTSAANENVGLIKAGTI